MKAYDLPGRMNTSIGPSAAVNADILAQNGEDCFLQLQLNCWIAGLKLEAAVRRPIILDRESPVTLLVQPAELR
jgi:hypothetical protein